VTCVEHEIGCNMMDMEILIVTVGDRHEQQRIGKSMNIEGPLHISVIYIMSER